MHNLDKKPFNSKRIWFVYDPEAAILHTYWSEEEALPQATKIYDTQGSVQAWSAILDNVEAMAYAKPALIPASCYGGS